MSTLWLIFSYALRDASRSRVVLFLVVVSLGVSFAAVLASASILSGFEDILDQGAINDSGDIIIGPSATSSTLSSIDDITNALDGISNVEAWSIRTYALGSVHYKTKYINPLTIRGIDPKREQETTHLGSSVTDGVYLSDIKPKDVILGKNLADALVGQSFDEKSIQVGEDIEINFLGVPTPLTYRVAGVFDLKNFVPNWILYIDKADLDAVTPFLKDAEISVSLRDPTLLDETKKEIQDAFPTLRVLSWKDNAGYVRDIVSVVDFITLTINRLLIVAIFVIICVIIFIGVLQKRRQIGIMKSMGAGKFFVISVFMFETLIYSLLAYGIGFGLFYGIYEYSIHHPTSTLIGDFMLSFDLHSIIQTSLILLFASLAGCFVPAYLAARTEIISVLQE